MSVTLRLFKYGRSKAAAWLLSVRLVEQMRSRFRQMPHTTLINIHLVRFNRFISLWDVAATTVPRIRKIDLGYTL